MTLILTKPKRQKWKVCGRIRAGVKESGGSRSPGSEQIEEARDLKRDQVEIKSKIIVKLEKCFLIYSLYCNYKLEKLFGQNVTIFFCHSKIEKEKKVVL